MSLFKSFSNWVFSAFLIDLWKFFIYSGFESFSDVCTVIIFYSVVCLIAHLTVFDEQKFFIFNAAQVTNFSSQLEFFYGLWCFFRGLGVHEN